MATVAITAGEWLKSPGFGGLAAVVAASIAYVGVRRSTAVQRKNARTDQWWDRLKWAVELALSPEPTKYKAGIRALEAVIDATGYDADEATFVANVADVFVEADGSGTLDSEEDSDDQADQ